MLTQVRNLSGAAKIGVMRAGIALIYAHWEGFVKEATTMYLKYVARRRSRYVELKPCFVALAVEAEVKRLNNLSVTQKRNRIADRYCSFKEDERATIPAREIDTHSNLNSQVLIDILEMIGLEASVFSTKFHLIDHSLLKMRNEIAHGRWIPISPERYEELHFEVLSLIQTAHRIIVSAAENRQYLR